jgi:DNA-binding Xre family transcriptional regulator
LTDKRDSSRYDNIEQENSIFSANIFHATLCVMAVELRIREAAEARGITTAYQLQKRMNVPPGTAARLWRGGMRMIGLDTIEALCEAIGCEPADLIVRTRTKKSTHK